MCYRRFYQKQQNDQIYDCCEFPSLEGNAYMGAVGPERTPFRSYTPSYIVIIYALYIPKDIITDERYVLNVNVSLIFNYGMNISLNGIPSTYNDTLDGFYGNLDNYTFHIGPTQTGTILLTESLIQKYLPIGIYTYDITNYIKQLQQDGLYDVYTALRLTGSTLDGCDLESSQCTTTGFVISGIEVTTRSTTDNTGLSGGLLALIIMIGLMIMMCTMVLIGRRLSRRITVPIVPIP